MASINVSPLVNPQSLPKNQWVPDSERSNCNSCKSKFGITLRKHHCRICGEIYCNKCSNYRYRFKHLRVCTFCIAKIKSSGESVEDSISRFRAAAALNPTGRPRSLSTDSNASLFTNDGRADERKDGGEGPSVETIDEEDDVPFSSVSPKKRVKSPIVSPASSAAQTKPVHQAENTTGASPMIKVLGVLGLLAVASAITWFTYTEEERAAKIRIVSQLLTDYNLM